MTRALHLADDDDVVIAIDAVSPGDDILGTIAREPLAVGHKMAIRTIRAGAPIHKYGHVIGMASRDIAAGEHVHSHNLAIGAAKPQTQGVASTPRTVTSPARRGASTFDGYHRADGRVGTRNAVGIIASVNCSATVVRRIARRFEDNLPPGVDAVVPITHSSGCGMARSGIGFDTLDRTLAGYARHPNFGAVLLIGLGCEVTQINDMLARHSLAPGERLRTLTIQDAGGTAEAIERGAAIIEDLVELVSGDRRSPRPISDLILGLQCGGSDGWSGVTANPALGVAADILVAAGATVILSETPEIFGAEHLLLARAKNPEVAAALSERIDWWQAHAAQHGVSLDNNPSPGNKAGGLTTIFEKSLGAVAKAGSSTLDDVILYAEPCRGHGLIFMDSPGYDPCSATGQIASGANLLAFTTGRGSVFGTQLTPCLKIASNAQMAGMMANDMDIDCSTILAGVPITEMGARIYDALLAMASGIPTKSEILGVGDYEFVPWQLGAWL